MPQNYSNQSANPRNQQRVSAHTRPVSLALRLVLLFGSWCWVLLSGQGAWADVPTEVEVRGQIKTTESATDMDNATKDILLEKYATVQNTLSQADYFETQSQSYQKQASNAPEKFQQIQTRIKALEDATGFNPSAATLNLSLSELKQKRFQLRTELTETRENLARLNNKELQETERPMILAGELTRANERKESLTKEPATDDKEENSILAEANQWLYATEMLRLSAEIAHLEQEQHTKQSRLELIAAEKTLTEYQISAVTEQINSIETLISERRADLAAETQQVAEKAKAKSAGKHQSITQLASRNAALSNDLTALTKIVGKLTEATVDSGEQLQILKKDFHNTRQQLEFAGINPSLGRLMLERRRALPDRTAYLRNITARETEIADAGLAQIRYEEDRRKLRNISIYLEELLTGIPEAEAARLKLELTSLLDSQRSIEEKLIDMNRTLLAALGELDLAERKYLSELDAYERFLTKHLLWVRSSSKLSISLLSLLPAETAKLFSGSDWSVLAEATLWQVANAPAILLAAIYLLLILSNKKNLKAELKSLGLRTRRIRDDQFFYTLKALGITVLLASPWALFAFTLGWQLSESLSDSNFVIAISTGLSWLAKVLFYILIFYYLCIPGGVAEKHFRWQNVNLIILRRHIKLLLKTFIPIFFLASVSLILEITYTEGILGRVTLSLSLISLSVTFFRILHPSKGALTLYINKNNLAAQFKYLWPALIIILPSALVIIAMTGFLYTATTLYALLIDTLFLLFALFVTHQMIIRWLFLNQRRYVFQAAAERLLAAKSKATEHDACQPDKTQTGTHADTEEPEIDLNSLSKDSRELLNSALIVIGVFSVYLIWGQVLPALDVWSDLKLWEITESVNGETITSAITLAEVLLAFVVMLITIACMKRFPALLEYVLLHRIEVTPGSRYTAATLSSYVIMAIGFIIVLNILGARWSQIQWLAAALGVGIGFGLQEIVANFISGIIILFERPIRVGDVVTVGDVDGVVTRIQIRATTVRDWDHKELLVPNKEFVTNRLLNWTLSDQTSRLLITIGVAYGSNIDQAMQLIVDAALENDKVIADPAPTATFENFGDDALIIFLRAYVGSTEHRVSTNSELHTAIYKNLNAAGIEFAFPQRDIHLDCKHPIEVSVNNRG